MLYKKRTLSQVNPQLLTWLRTVNESVPIDIISNPSQNVNISSENNSDIMKEDRTAERREMSRAAYAEYQKDVDEYRAARNKTETLFKNCFNNLFAAIGGIFPMVDVVVAEKIIVALA